MGNFNLKSFKFKGYEETPADEHIEKRLRTQHQDEQTDITEEQIDSGRVEETTDITEKQLDKVRLSEDATVMEKRLNDSKSKLVTHRDSSTSDGDINKLEEKRLANSPIEEEKYKTNSKTPGKFRWWEEKGEKGVDGNNLKLATKKESDTKVKFVTLDQISKIKVAKKEEDEDALDFDEEKRWERVPKMWSEEEGLAPGDEKAPELPTLPEENPIDAEDDVVGGRMEILEDKEILHTSPPGLKMILGYDTDEMTKPEAIKEALRVILKKRPELINLIDESDLYAKEHGLQGTVSLRIGGDHLLGILGHENKEIEENTSETFKEISYKEGDETGTPVALGQIKVSTPINEDNEQHIMKNAVDFIIDKHPDLYIDTNSLDLSNVSQGIIGYVAAIPESKVEKEEFPITETPETKPETPAPTETPEEFPIEEVPPNIAKSTYNTKTAQKKN